MQSIAVRSATCLPKQTTRQVWCHSLRHGTIVFLVTISPQKSIYFANDTIQIVIFYRTAAVHASTALLRCHLKCRDVRLSLSGSQLWSLGWCLPPLQELRLPTALPQRMRQPPVWAPSQWRELRNREYLQRERLPSFKSWRSLSQPEICLNTWCHVCITSMCVHCSHTRVIQLLFEHRSLLSPILNLSINITPPPDAESLGISRVSNSILTWRIATMSEYLILWYIYTRMCLIHIVTPVQYESYIEAHEVS